MVEQISERKQPSGFTRWLYRLPLHLYHAGLGWLLGSRFVRLEHEGRVSGKAREVVLETVKSEPEAGVFFVVAAWGERADWFLNIKANPEVMYQVGRRVFSGQAEVLTEDWAEEVFVAYGRRHPRMLKNFIRLVGYRIEGDEQAFRQLAEHLPVVKLSPEQGKRV